MQRISTTQWQLDLPLEQVVEQEEETSGLQAVWYKFLVLPGGAWCLSEDAALPTEQDAAGNWNHVMYINVPSVSYLSSSGMAACGLATRLAHDMTCCFGVHLKRNSECQAQGVGELAAAPRLGCHPRQ
jgi:hypothetical protein